MKFNKDEVLDNIKIECEQIVNYPKIFGSAIGKLQLIERFLKEGIQEMADKANIILAKLPTEHSQELRDETIMVIQSYIISTPKKLI